MDLITSKKEVFYFQSMVSGGHWEDCEGILNQNLTHAQMLERVPFFKQSSRRFRVIHKTTTTNLKAVDV